MDNEVGEPLGTFLWSETGKLIEPINQSMRAYLLLAIPDAEPVDAVDFGKLILTTATLAKAIDCPLDVVQLGTGSLFAFFEIKSAVDASQIASLMVALYALRKPEPKTLIREVILDVVKAAPGRAIIYEAADGTRITFMEQENELHAVFRSADGEVHQDERKLTSGKPGTRPIIAPATIMWLEGRAYARGGPSSPLGEEMWELQGKMGRVKHQSKVEIRGLATVDPDGKRSIEVKSIRRRK